MLSDHNSEMQIPKTINRNGGEIGLFNVMVKKLFRAKLT
jgi:hypothetical protein